MSSDVELFCPDCGYSLRGIDSGKCPECGLLIDREKLARSALPWSYRGDIGFAPAYLRTVRLALRHPSRLGNEVSRPVSYRDAKAFRRVTILFATAILMIAIAIGHSIILANVTRGLPAPVGGLRAEHAKLGWWLQMGLLPVIWIALYLFLLACSAVASSFFRPRQLPQERQHRALAISCYAVAPMALTPFTVMAVSLAIAMFVDDGMRSATPLPLKALIWLIGCIVPLIQGIAALAVPMKLLGRAVPHGGMRPWAMAATLPIAWAVLGLVIAAGLPLAYLFVSLVVLSLRA